MSLTARLLQSVRHHNLLRPGSNFHYIEAGNSNGFPIMLVHGWPDYWFTWRHQIPMLVQNGFRVFAPDLPGFGQSTGTPQDPSRYSFRTVASDLVAILDAHDMKSSVLVGHDWGGAVVWRAALWHPTRFSAVAAICTPYRPRSSKFMPLEQIVKLLPAMYYQVYFNEEGGVRAASEMDSQVSRTFRCLYRSGRKSEAVGHWMQPGDKTLLAHFPADPPRSDILSQEELDEHVATFERSGFLGGLPFYHTTKINWDEEATMPRTVTQPALMISATEDTILKPSMTEGMEAWVPNLTRASVEAAHWAHWEQKDAVNAALLSWLNSTVKLGTSKL
mmetsp:Transcript_23067/g.53942  ORF Transcript_23067/g.53942 Transcript_23067/m.53942 type:complete len:332 (+) Transcript_23067:57-1052(+)|eukprot:CAMPEP_0114560552 /NCGR_PEP_ID=MMETSP0114-20121206/11520_1 /TAXON_ID=31324 /ORGANISM="Goniomonas sp, Strain m" /LENGTH=331 /DNA_ID=CAMNT_0001746105 /DNA_START=50 /DNA_END=1045 /DNA_ORIENTATION=-